MTLHTPPAQPQRLKLIRTLPLATFLVALSAVIVTPRAAAQTAQKERHGENRAQAELRIQARVVQVTYSPSEGKPPKAFENAIIYTLSSGHPGMTMVEEIHPVSGADVAVWLGRRAVQAAVLKTMTVVAQ